ncbi:DUF890 domain-containing protein, partial [Staphylococcus aureus]
MQYWDIPQDFLCPPIPGRADYIHYLADLLSAKAQAKKTFPQQKSELHVRNLHRSRYDFPQLIKTCPELAPFVRLNPYNDLSIDFSDPQAVKMLNKALLKHFYGIQYWDIPQDFLCPPIPGRADYIHYLADLLSA